MGSTPDENASGLPSNSSADLVRHQHTDVRTGNERQMTVTM